MNVDVSDVQLKVLTLSRQFIATIGTFEATRFIIYFHKFLPAGIVDEIPTRSNIG